MEDLLNHSISLQEIVSFYENTPWAWHVTYIVYCLTIGTLQCRWMSKKMIHNSLGRRISEYGIEREYDKGGARFGIFMAQIFAPLISAFLLLCVFLTSIIWMINKCYFKDWEKSHDIN